MKRPLFATRTAEIKLSRLFICGCYTQCPKAFIRSDLWNADKHIDKKTLPTGGQILRELHGIDADEDDRARAERYARRERFY